MISFSSARIFKALVHSFFQPNKLNTPSIEKHHLVIYKEKTDGLNLKHTGSIYMVCKAAISVRAICFCHNQEEGREVLLLILQGLFSLRNNNLYIYMQVGADQREIKMAPSLF